MNYHEIKIILPLSLDGLPKYGDLIDVSLCTVDKMKEIIIEDDCEIENFDILSDLLFVRFGFLIGYGDYYFLFEKDCIKLKKYLEDNIDDVKKLLSKSIYNKLIEFCDEAIKLKTGLGFDF